jgi:hypothetical protein
MVSATWNGMNREKVERVRWTIKVYGNAREVAGVRCTTQLGQL